MRVSYSGNTGLSKSSNVGSIPTTRAKLQKTPLSVFCVFILTFFENELLFR